MSRLTSCERRMRPWKVSGLKRSSIVHSSLGDWSGYRLGYGACLHEPFNTNTNRSTQSVRSADGHRATQERFSVLFCFVRLPDVHVSVLRVRAQQSAVCWQSLRFPCDSDDFPSDIVFLHRFLLSFSFTNVWLNKIMTWPKQSSLKLEVVADAVKFPFGCLIGPVKLSQACIQSQVFFVLAFSLKAPDSVKRCCANMVPSQRPLCNTLHTLTQTLLSASVHNMLLTRSNDSLTTNSRKRKYFLLDILHCKLRAG